MNAGYPAALSVALLWAVTSLCYAGAGLRIGSGAVNHLRLWAALLITMVIHKLVVGSILPPTLDSTQILLLSVSGIVGFVLGDALLLEAYVLIGPRVTMLIMTAAPVFGAVLGWSFMGEPLGAGQLIAIALTLSGIALVVAGREDRGAGKPAAGSPRGWGIVLAFGAALGQAGGLILSKMALRDDLSVLSANLVRLAAATILFFFYSLVAGRALHHFRQSADLRAGVMILAGTIVGPVLGVSLSLYAVRGVEVGVASALMQLSPVFLLPLAAAFSHERISRRSLGGTLVAVAGAGLLFLVA
jgi:drug/metabolite transporter (DMT)-like permease